MELESKMALHPYVMAKMSFIVEDPFAIKISHDDPIELSANSGSLTDDSKIIPSILFIGVLEMPGLGTI